MAPMPIEPKIRRLFIIAAALSTLLVAACDGQRARETAPRWHTGNIDVVDTPSDERMDCAPADFGAATSLSSLPLGVHVALLDDGTMSDKGGAFDAGDTLGSDPAPSRRFGFGAVGSDWVYVAVEQGGVGYSVALWSFEWQGFHWHGHPVRSIGVVPANVSQLVAAICNEAGPSAFPASEVRPPPPVADAPPTPQIHCLREPDGLTILRLERGRPYSAYEMNRRVAVTSIAPHEGITRYGSALVPSAAERAELLATLQAARSSMDEADPCHPAVEQYVAELRRGAAPP